MKSRIVDLPHISDHRGDLTVVEHQGQMPFEVKRAFWTYNVPEGKSRGAHAHKRLRQLLVAISGSFTVFVDDGHEQRSFLLDCPWKGVIVEPGEWSSEDYYSPGAVCMVLASDAYNESDYIRNYDEFLAYVHDNNL